MRSRWAVYALMAVGIGLVFGVLRLVNFAYGQLVMAGAFALALASQWGWPVWAGIVLCFAVVLVLSMLMDRLVFRPAPRPFPGRDAHRHVRGRIPAAEHRAALVRAAREDRVVARVPEPAVDDLQRRHPEDRHRLGGRRGGRVFSLLQLLLERTDIGLHMRASSMDFETARMLGVRANRVIGFAVLLSGALAAVVAVMLTVQNPLVTPDFALRDTIVVLAGVVVGGMNRPVPATLGGFTIGFATGLLGGALPTSQSQYIDSFIFAAVIVVLLVRPNGLFTRTRTVERV